MKPTTPIALTLLLSLTTAAGALRAQDPTQAARPEARPAKTPEEVAAEARFSRAREQLADGDVEAAVATLEPFRQDPRTPPPVLGLLGALYLQLGRSEDALAVLAPLADSPEADPAALYNAGRAALAVGRSATAQAYLRRSVELESGTPASRELGLLDARQGNCQEAYPLLVPWARVDPQDLAVRKAAAGCAIQLERAPEAESLLSDLPQSEPDVRLLWGRLLLLREDAHGALATLRPLLAEGTPEPIEVGARLTMAEAHVALGESDRAVELLAGREAGEPEVALTLARARHRGGDLEGALGILEPIAAPIPEAGTELPTGLTPDLAGEIATDYGRMLLAASRFEEALPYLTRATELRPDDRGAWQGLGQALAALGRDEDAREAMERFDRLARTEPPPGLGDIQAEGGPEDPTGQALREAIRLLREDRGEEALDVLRREIEIRPEDVRPRLLEARILLALGSPEAALEAVERAVKMAPNSADAHYQRGAVQMALHHSGQAEAELRRALELSPEHTAAMADLGVLLMAQGKNYEARRLFERILELRPGDPVATRHLETLNAQSPGG